MVGVSRGNGDPRTCDFDLGLAGISRSCNDFSLAVVLTAGCDFDFGFGHVSALSLSMNSLLMIRVFFWPSYKDVPFPFLPSGLLCGSQLVAWTGLRGSPRLLGYRWSIAGCRHQEQRRWERRIGWYQERCRWTSQESWRCQGEGAIITFHQEGRGSCVQDVVNLAPID